MKMRLAQCLKCRAYTLLGDDRVMAVAVGVAAADRETYIATVLRRGALVAVEKRPDGALKGRTVAVGTVEPSWDENGAQTGAQRLHVEHEHPARDQRPVAVNDAGPRQAPATPGKAWAGSPPPAAHVAGAAARPCRAPSATHLRSRPVRCDVCNRVIADGEPRFEIRYETYAWGVHEECP